MKEFPRYEPRELSGGSIMIIVFLRLSTAGSFNVCFDYASYSNSFGLSVIFLKLSLRRSVRTYYVTAPLKFFLILLTLLIKFFGQFLYVLQASYAT